MINSLSLENFSLMALNSESVQSDFRVGVIHYIIEYKPLLFRKINECYNHECYNISTVMISEYCDKLNAASGDF